MNHEPEHDAWAEYLEDLRRYGALSAERRAAVGEALREAEPTAADVAALLDALEPVADGRQRLLAVVLPQIVQPWWFGDPAFKAEAVLLPSESYIADRLDIVDPDAIHSVRDRLRGEIGRALRDEIAAAYFACESDPASLSPRDKGLRRLRSAMLGYLIAVDPVAGAARAKAQFDGARTMTERQSALAALSIVGGSDAPPKIT